MAAAREAAAGTASPSSTKQGGGVASGADTSGPEPKAGSPELPRWLAKQAAAKMAMDAAAAGSVSTVKLEGDKKGGQQDGGTPDGDQPWTIWRTTKTIKGRDLTTGSVYSLVFALLGRPAGRDEDVDLKMAMSSGPSSSLKKRKAVSPKSAQGKDSGSGKKDSSPSTPASENGPSLLNERSLKTMNGAGGAGGSMSRSEVNKEKYALSSNAKKDKETKELADVRLFKAWRRPKSSRRAPSRFVQAWNCCRRR